MAIVKWTEEETRALFDAMLRDELPAGFVLELPLSDDITAEELDEFVAFIEEFGVPCEIESDASQPMPNENTVEPTGEVAEAMSGNVHEPLPWCVYDVHGNVTSSGDSGYVTTYCYDANGYLVVAPRPSGRGKRRRNGADAQRNRRRKSAGKSTAGRR